jgi:hypothetical protein
MTSDSGLMSLRMCQPYSGSTRRQLKSGSHADRESVLVSLVARPVNEPEVEHVSEKVEVA